MSDHTELTNCLCQMVEDMGLTAEGFARRMNTGTRTVERWLEGKTSDPFLLLQAWHIAEANWKLRLLPFIPGEIERWAVAFRRSA